MRNALIFGVIFTVFGLASNTATADDWATEAELGLVITTGNTDQQNLKARLNTSLDGEVLKHAVKVDALRSSENSVVTAQKYYGAYQVDYKLEGDHSLFTRASYEDDKFSGFKYQTDLTVGYSRLLMERDNMSLRGDIGAGMRRSELDTGMTESEFLTRLAARYIWQVSENAKFQQLVAAEIGADSTITRSETSLQANVSGSLAMKLALNVKHQSEVPVGRDKTDTETSVTLVYSF